jgi:hypothetical protein
MSEIFGMLVAQDKFSGRLYLAWFVAMHLCDRVRPRPGVGVVAVLEGAGWNRLLPDSERLSRKKLCFLRVELLLGQDAFISQIGQLP